LYYEEERKEDQKQTVLSLIGLNDNGRDSIKGKFDIIRLFLMLLLFHHIRRDMFISCILVLSTWQNHAFYHC
jgi:hypothetical protein